LPRYYADYATNVKALLVHAKPLDKLHPQDTATRSAVDKWLARHHRLRSDTVWLPMTARFADLTALLDKKTGTWLGAIAVDPW
jgi:hypothetical protein